MKKVILSALAVMTFGFANAQEGNGNGGFSKGSMFISGALSIESTKTGEAKSSGFEIEPRFGYFVTDNIAIGGKLGFGTSKAEVAGVDTVDNSAFTVGAFGRYYFTPASQFSLFGQAGLDYSSIKNNLPGADFKANEIGINVGLGLSYFVSNDWAIEATWAGLGYTSNDNGGDGAEKTSTFGLGADLRAISFGVVYKF
ncbi:outer membrane protein [Flavobacterium arsenatis]|uniref:Outer membrane protein n=1 Tax=Flavobacterium arsenatis TaxID=1484332 RepID=A0ABU1TPP9_9FLAO|nr:porin family protein [Flavobacterium arsenatis]MDR6967936.1 outer membrane protein [Flavobacterium arsenatis]